MPCYTNNQLFTIMHKFLLWMLCAFTIPATPSIAQNIGGIGAQLIIDTTGGFTMPRIFGLVQNSPAWDSLKATDYIMKVNGTSCKDKTIEEVVSLIRGEAGTPIDIIVADTKQGARPRAYTLIRVSMQLPSPPDPTPAFYAACDNEAKQLKKNGSAIIKTYHSDCGNFFFNFDAGNGQYHIRVITLPEKADGTNPSGYILSAKVFDTDHEADATTLGKPEMKDGLQRLEGTATFTHNTVGVVSVTINNDVKKCLAMYVMVYE